MRSAPPASNVRHRRLSASLASPGGRGCRRRRDGDGLVARFSSQVQQDLRAAGWQPGRIVDVGGWRQRREAGGVVRMHPAAAGFLAEFGGLTVDIAGSGVSMARQPFELDPDLADGEEDRFVEWGAELGCSLFPIGVLDLGRFFLGISEIGEIFLVETWVASFGIGDTALEHLILGVAPQER